MAVKAIMSQKENNKIIFGVSVTFFSCVHIMVILPEFVFRYYLANWCVQLRLEATQ